MTGLIIIRCLLEESRSRQQSYRWGTVSSFGIAEWAFSHPLYDINLLSQLALPGRFVGLGWAAPQTLTSSFSSSKPDVSTTRPLFIISESSCSTSLSRSINNGQLAMYFGKSSQRPIPRTTSLSDTRSGQGETKFCGQRKVVAMFHCSLRGL